jgi:predicted helicase
LGFAALRDPLCRKEYVQTLERALPRIPFYSDYWRSAEWGAKLMALHLGYESVEPRPLKRINMTNAKLQMSFR